MICGKGGCGKSVVTVLLAKAIVDLGYEVAVVDSDESNTTLNKMLGLSQPKPIIEYLGGRRRVVDEMKRGVEGEVDIAKALSRAREGIVLDELPRDYVASRGSLKLIVIGKVKEFGEGCACPLNFVTRAFLSNLILGEKDFVLIDTDAGVEHVGRGVEKAVDRILAVAEPSYESLVIADTLRKTALKLNKKFNLVLNKIHPEVKDEVVALAERLGLKPDCIIPFDKEVFIKSLSGEEVYGSQAYRAVKELADKIVSECRRC